MKQGREFNIPYTRTVLNFKAKHIFSHLMHYSGYLSGTGIDYFFVYVCNVYFCEYFFISVT